MQKSIKSIFIMWYLCLAVLPLLIVGIIWASRGFLVQKQQSVIIQNQTATRVASHLISLMQKIESELNIIIRIRGLSGLKPDNQQKILFELLAYQNDFEEIYILDENGRESIKVHQYEIITKKNLINKHDSPEFLALQNGEQSYYSKIFFHSVTGEPMINIALPFIDLNNNLLSGALVAKVRLKKIWDLLNQIEKLKGENFYILSSDNRIISHPNPSIVLKNTYYRTSLTEQGDIIPGLMDTPVLAVQKTIKIGNQKIRVVVERDIGEAFKFVYQSIIIISVLFVISIFMALGMLLILFKYILNPIQKLSTTVKAMESGAFENKVEVVRNDEIGFLSITFNQMSDKMHNLLQGLKTEINERVQTEKELNQIKNNLESLVSTRTEDLKKANINLIKAKNTADIANKAKSEFLSNMSHEIRTPMHHILSFSNFGKKKIELASRKKLLHYFETISETGTHLMSLLNDILDLSKLESGKMTYDMAFENLNKIATDIIEEFRITIEENRINILFKQDYKSSLIYCDKTRISQVIRNLISNAIKFTPKEENISIKIKETELKVKTTTNDPIIFPALSFTIRDEGVGIPEEELNTIFDKFIQSSLTKTGSGGTGLGLAICKEIVEAHHGTIKAFNNIEAGSSFNFILPLKPVK